VAGGITASRSDDATRAGTFTARLNTLLQTHAEQFRELDRRAALLDRGLRTRAPALPRDAPQVSRRSRQLSLPIRCSARR
jgi:hypothetical protein